MAACAIEVCHLYEIQAVTLRHHPFTQKSWHHYPGPKRTINARCRPGAFLPGIPPINRVGDVEHLRLRVVNGFLKKLCQLFVRLGCHGVWRSIQAILDECMLDGESQPGLSTKVRQSGSLLALTITGCKVFLRKPVWPRVVRCAPLAYSEPN